jgi:ADP-ribose pyrophosphatase YjhB (NUDIX family)
VEVVHRHLTSSMCESVFRDLRTSERARAWTLEMMARFWVAVILRAPASLREALEEAHEGVGGFPAVRTTSSSFFARAQGMRWEFFAELFERFLASTLAEAQQDFESVLREELPQFPEVWVVDGSGLDRVAHRLKVTRGDRRVLIPGSVLAFYDLFRGVLRGLVFRETIVAGEVAALRKSLDRVPQGTLLIMDRGFSSMRVLDELAARRVDAVMRLKSNVVAKDRALLAESDDDGIRVTDELVTLGTRSKGAPRVRVRLIEKPLAGGSTLRLATTVLDPQRLPAAKLLALYRRRWTVERLFHDLKRVLNLHRVYAANTNAVAMQVFACAIVHTALRVTQARIARAHRLVPEALSTQKLFPRIAAAHYRLLDFVEYFELTRAANPGVELIPPDTAAMSIYRVRLRRVLLQRRRGPRRDDRYSPERLYYVSLQRHERRPRPRGSSP